MFLVLFPCMDTFSVPNLGLDFYVKYLILLPFPKYWSRPLSWFIELFGFFIFCDAFQSYRLSNTEHINLIEIFFGFKQR